DCKRVTDKRMKMRSMLLPIAFLWALAASSAAAQTCPDAARLTAGVTGPLAHVRYVADDALEGRMSGTAGERCAGEYVAARFRTLGLEPAGDSWSFFQRFPLVSATNPHASGGTGQNVVAMLRGSTTPDEVVIVGAHIDHLGHGGQFSMARGDSSVHNGADDNASGVAVLLDVAERLARGPRPARSVVFVAFSGEGLGLIGSSYHTQPPVLPLARTRAMLNLDMVGRLGAGPLIVYGTDTADEWKGMVDSAAPGRGVQGRGG